MADEQTITTEQPPVAAADAPAPDAAAPGKDAAAPDSPPSDEGKGAGNEPKSSLEALSQRLKQMQAKAEEKVEAKADKPEGEAKPEEDDAPGDTPEEKAAFKGKDAETKIRTLSKERRALRKENEKLREQVAAVEPVKQKAQAFDEFSGWVRQTGLTQDEVTQGLTISGLMKSDPFKALEMVTPIYAELQRRAGAVLPDDLRAEVDAGMVTEDRAKEIARLRQQSQHAQQNWQQTAEQRQAEQEQARVNGLQNAVRSAVNAAEQQVARDDPDYGKKKGMVATKIQAWMLERGAPATPEAAVQMYKDALKAVNDDIALIAPRKSSIQPQPAQGGGNAVAAPKTSAEAVRLAAMKSGVRITG